jgi:hypothetical protein
MKNLALNEPHLPILTDFFALRLILEEAEEEDALLEFLEFDYLLLLLERILVSYLELILR